MSSGYIPSKGDIIKLDSAMEENGLSERPRKNRSGAFLSG
jgi:hypothetical protein